MFDQLANRYDKINRILSLGMDLHWRRCAAAYLPKKKELILLDVASGTGDQLIACFESGASIAHAIGVDLSFPMLAIAKEKVTKKSYQNQIQWCQADGQKLPYADHCFDAVSCSFGIRNIRDPLLALSEFYRVLKQGGSSIILEFSLPSHPLRIFHRWYLRYLLPLLGGVLSKNKKAYIYLNQTIEKFPHGKAFCSLMEQCGFQKIQKRSLAFGAVTIYVGIKPIPVPLRRNGYILK